MTPIHLPAVIAVSGVSFRQAELREVVEGDLVVIECDDENPHDPDAVRISTSAGVQLGYVPRQLAPRLRATGASTWSGRVVDVLRNETWGLRVEVHPHGTELTSPRTRREAAIARGRVNNELAVGGPDEVALQDVAEPTPADVVHVLAPSGRLLGILVREAGEYVIAVRDGVEVSFPTRSITLRRAG